MGLFGACGFGLFVLGVLWGVFGLVVAGFGVCVSVGSESGGRGENWGVWRTPAGLVGRSQER